MDDLVSEINLRTQRGERVLVTTLTKAMAEDLTEYLEGFSIKVRYMHHDVDTMERMEIIRDLRLGEFDVLVGINLLREGLDIPEVSLVAILDADKEGFLRSETSLVQTIGRAARNANGEVIMYADSVTPSMERAIRETLRRRTIQEAYNAEHGIVPKSIIKGVREILEISKTAEEDTLRAHKKRKLTEQERAAEIAKLEKYLGGVKEMKKLPGALFIVDTRKERNAIAEAHKLGIPVVAIADTNCDPDEIDYPIPGNDDAIRAIKLIASVMANAMIEGRQGEQNEEAAEAKDAE